MRDVAANARLARARIDDVWIGVRHRQSANRRGCEEAIGDVLPVGAAVRGFPDATTAATEIERAGIDRVARHGDTPAAPMRTNTAKLEGFEEALVHQKVG